MEGGLSNRMLCLDKEVFMRLHVYPDPFLRKTVKPVDKFDDELRAEVREMLEIMHREKGVGLAANQAGLDKRVVVINMTGDPKDDLVLLNPEITARKGKQYEEEACLSVPGIEGCVRRSAFVHVKAYNLDGEPFEYDADGYLAIASQHELDHLEGILFIDKLGPAKKIGIKKKLRELEEVRAE